MFSANCDKGRGYDFGFLFVADGGEGEGGGFGVAFGDDNMSLFLLEFGLMGGEGFVEFDDFAFGGVFFWKRVSI